jgi:hypothetical protein
MATLRDPKGDNSFPRLNAVRAMTGLPTFGHNRDDRGDEDDEGDD